MKLFDSFCAALVHLLSVLTFSNHNEDGIGQIPLLADESTSIKAANGPVFRPPGRTPGGVGDKFTCDYSRMSGWRECSTPEDRTCWLKNDKGEKFDIYTDYEKVKPEGILRKFTMDIVDNKTLNVDGMLFTEGKLFDNQYPGPWLQACWGDTVEVVVNNKMKHNGTSVHWHGIRQLHSMHMDGVNGVTQCPIAPNQSFTYRWEARQYGSSWYHSHYSMQYGFVSLLQSSFANADYSVVSLRLVSEGATLSKVLQ
jgi:hypothetical protein